MAAVSLAFSRGKRAIWLRYVLVGILSVAGFANVCRCIVGIFPPRVYDTRDLAQEYTMARAVLLGENPYQQLPDLVARFVQIPPEQLAGWTLYSFSPHPPPVVVLALPLGLLSYQAASWAWFVFELVCVVGAASLVWGCRFGQPLTPATVTLAGLLALAWYPAAEGMYWGQLMTVLLLLLTGAWLALLSGQDRLGGILLGLSVALKLLTWPLIVLLVFRRRWQAAGASVLALAAANVAAGVVMGFDHVVDYYVHIGPQVFSLYRNHGSSFSTPSLIWRLFEGTGSPLMEGMIAPPLVNAVWAAQPLSMLVSLSLVGLVLYVTRKSSFEGAFGVLVCVSLSISPVAWMHYLTLALIPVVIVGSRLFESRFPKQESGVAYLVGFLLHTHVWVWQIVLRSVEGRLDHPVVPFAVSLLPLVPTLLPVLGLAWLVWRLEQKGVTVQW
ncbi:MAG: DUF2029 domain-containing protein [Thermoflexales bacterium]|nr:DUF2029 domain-containing protein [Thermoflexales bacterium]